MWLSYLILRSIQLVHHFAVDKQLMLQILAHLPRAPAKGAERERGRPFSKRTHSSKRTHASKRTHSSLRKARSVSVAVLLLMALSLRFT